MSTSPTIRQNRRRERNTHVLASRASDAARRVGLSRSALYDLVREGKLSAIRVGRCVLIRETELERFLAENETRGGQ